MGFTLPIPLLEIAVRSYRTISPLPDVESGGIFSVALSVKRASRLLPRPLAGILPCGDRTFLSPKRAIACPADNDVMYIENCYKERGFASIKSISSAERLIELRGGRSICNRPAILVS